MREEFKTSAGGDVAVWGTSDPWNQPRAPNPCDVP